RVPVLRGLDVRGNSVVAGVLQQQRVTVGRGLGHGVRGNGAGGARLVFHHHALAQGFAQRLGDQAGGQIGGAAGRGGNQQRHGAVGIVGGQGGTGDDRQDGGGQTGA